MGGWSRRDSLGLGLAGLGSLLLAGNAQASEGAQLVVLVRHAEKGAGEDPPLTKEGEWRAQALSQVLRSVGIGAVFSTDTRRTRATAEPTAKLGGVQVALYAPNDAAAVAERVRNLGLPTLIVGHSNTLRTLSQTFGGGDMGDLEHGEYDRLELLILVGAAAHRFSLRQAAVGPVGTSAH